MFDKFKQALNSKAEQVRELRANPGPPDITVLPDLDPGFNRRAVVDAFPRCWRC